jgi:hypothetical protein
MATIATPRTQHGASKVLAGVGRHRRWDFSETRQANAGSEASQAQSRDRLEKENE